MSNLPINDSNALSSIKLSGSAGKSKKSSDDPSTPYLTQSLLYHRHVISGFLTGVSRDLPVDVITCYLRSLLDSDAYLTDAALISIGIIVQKLVFSYSKDLISKSDDNNGSTYDFDKSFLLSQYPIAVTSTSTESCTDIAVWSDIESVLFRYFCLTSSILERQRYIRQSRHSDVFEDDDDENENDDVDIVGDDIADNHRESKKITSLGYSGCTLILVLNYVSVLTWIRHNKITWTQDNSFVDSAQWNDLTRQFGSRSVFQGVSSQIQTTLDSQVAIPGYLILSEIAAAVSSFRDNCASVAWKLFTMLFPDLLDLSVSTSHSSYNLANTSMLLGYSELLPYLHVTLNRCESYQQNILELSSSWEPKFTQPIATQLSSLHAMFYPSATGNKGKTFHRSVASVWYFCMAWWNQESSSQGRISGVSCLLNEVLGKALGQIKVVKRSESNTSSKAKISTKRKRKRDKRYHTKKNSFRFDDDSYSGSDADSIDSASVNDDEDDDDDMDRFGDINDEDNEDNNNSSRKSTDGVVDFNHVNLIQQKYLKHDESLQNENTILFASISTTNLEPHYYIATGLLPLLIMTTKPCVPNPDVENKSKNIAQVVSPYCDFIASCQLFIWTLRSIKQQMTRSESASFLLTHTPYSCRTFRLIILAIEGSLAKILAWRCQPLPADTSNSNLMTDEGDLEDSDWQSIDYLFPVFEIAIASCELVIDYTNLWKMFLVKGGKSFEAPRRMGPSMMKLQQVAEMAVARIRRSGDIHQLDLSELSKPQVGSELNDMFRGTHYDINTFLARRERELSSTISFPLQSSSSEPNNSVEFTPVANYFYDPMSISSNEAEINGNERQIMVESDSSRSGGWGLYNYSA